VGVVSTDEGMGPSREASPSNDVRTTTHRDGHAIHATTSQGIRCASRPNDHGRTTNSRDGPAIVQMLVGFQQQDLKQTVTLPLQ
jgi:hypothetical protein